MMSGSSLLSLSMSDSYEPAPVSSYLEELQSLQSPINRTGKLGEQFCSSFVVQDSRNELGNDTRNSASTRVDGKANETHSNPSPCPDVTVEGSCPSGHQSIARSQSCPIPCSLLSASMLDWHSELILATQTLQAFSMVDRGQLDWDD